MNNLKKLKTRLIQKLLIVAIISILLTAFSIASVSWLTFTTQIQSDLRDYGQIITAAYNSDESVELLKSFNAKGYRITLIRKDGVVLYESNTSLSVEKMDNHLNRPEIEHTIKNGASSIYRLSESLGYSTYYYAMKTNNGSILRVGKQIDSIFNSFAELFPLVVCVILVVLVLSYFMASNSTKKIVEPIEKMTYDINNIAYEELIPFATTIEKQQSQIKKQIKKVQLEKDKINALIANMNEGFLLLDMDQTVLMSNESAYMLLSSIYDTIEGKNVIEISKDIEFVNCVNEAIKGKNSTAKFSQNNNKFQVIASPVFSNDKQKGVICLIVNITEREKTEKMRRDFTANVSHELKTPLTSISGYAEMIENGMVQNEDDIQRFAGKIHKEAGRLISLILDIINLSQLDEPQQNIEKQYVNVREIVEECFDALQHSANKRGVTLNHNGKDVILLCSRSLIYEVIYNLCDNAIRYNKPNGNIDVLITDKIDTVEITVKDTGIGIPLKHQDRIFERFYRVDKSHSKETGGTGLGLAIVKHIIEQHNGSISINSVENEGTSINIQLPK